MYLKCVGILIGADTNITNIMWLFKKKTSTLKDSGLFHGFTDWHSHILPGVDDGIKTIDESLEVLSTFESLGVDKVWLTPHIMDDYPNETNYLREQFDILKNAWKGADEIKLASENMLDSLFEARLEKEDLLPIGDEGCHLLVETSYYTPPFGMDGILDSIMQKGYFPVLAHPERYRYMDENDYKNLKSKGVLFQMNLLSLVGGYGGVAQSKAEWLLSHDMVNFMGSDLHKLNTVLFYLDKSPSKKSMLDRLNKLSTKEI